MSVDKRRLLIVDDEDSILKALQQGLTMLGYDVVTVDNGRAALAMLGQRAFDLMLLDLQMPGIHGTEVMRRAREQSSDLLIVVLTGAATLESAIEAVRSHAVDYLLKPASIKEVVEAIEHALRGHADEQRRKRVLQTLLQLTEPLRTASPERIAAAQPPNGRPIHLDDATRLVYVGESEVAVSLTEGEAAILRIFLNAPRRVFTCRELATQAWAYDLEEIEAQTLIRPYIFRLRRKLESDPAQPQCIRTVRGRGYMWGE